jgi:hypothetical protein
LQQFEPMATQLTPERINIEMAHQLFPEADPAYPSNVFAGTSGTNRLCH